MTQPTCWFVRIVVVIVIGSTHSIDDDSFQSSFELKVRRTCRVSAASVNGSNVTRERQFLCSDFCFSVVFMFMPLSSSHERDADDTLRGNVSSLFCFACCCWCLERKLQCANIIMNFKCRELSPEVYQIDFISCHFVFVVRSYSSKFYVASVRSRCERRIFSVKWHH